VPPVAPVKEERIMPDHSAELLFRRYIDVWESGNPSALASIIHENCVGHPSWGDRDREGLRQRILAFRQKYGNASFNPREQLVEGDKVASRMTATARSVLEGQDVVLSG
jgi:hypothetical protein